MIENVTGDYKVNLKRVFIFLLISVTLSNIFRFNLFQTQGFFEILPAWVFVLVTVFLEGSGVFLGAIFCLYLLKKDRPSLISFFGSSKQFSLVMGAVPIILLSVVGVDNEYGLNSHLYGFIATFGTLIYCIMEEYGWRGYLQEELGGLAPWKKYTLIGFVWYFWHLSFLADTTLGDNLFFLSMMILGSWGIGQVADMTKSIMASACFHLIVQIMMFNALIRNGIDGTEKIFILAISVVIWVVILKKWEKQIKNVQ
ncbi:MAG: CPBP family intramembrane metalloprotease [Alphaproteobacteria bacterium]|nr:CPBP family intramembrane metalloprotease [Alphaproteobacteria bacterium]